MVANALPRPRNYNIWEVEKLGTEGVKRYICFRMYARPDDQTNRAVQMSSFMYGFFKGDAQAYGMACWYAVLTDETRELAEDLLAGAIWGKP